MKDRLAGLPVIGTAMAVQDRYKTDAGDQFAGAIGFFGFLSLFPLIVLALSIVGFVLADESAAEIAVVTRKIQDAIPGFAALAGDGETSISTAMKSIIENRGSIGLIGLVTLLVSGLRVINSAQTAMLKIFRIDILDVPGWKLKAQQLGTLFALGLLGGLGVVATTVTGAVTQFGLVGPLAVLVPVVGLVVGFVVDSLFFLAAYRIFATSAGPHWRTFIPGAILAGVGWTLLKTVGTTYVSGQVESNQALYGALGGVIALLLLLYLAGRLYIYGAELSAVQNPPGTEDWDLHDGLDADGRPIDTGLGGRTIEDPDANLSQAAVAAAEPVGAAALGVAGPVPATPMRLSAVGVAHDESALFGEEPGVPAAPRLDVDQPSSTVSPATEARLAAREAARLDSAGDEEHGPRQAAALIIAVGAIAGLASAMKPWRKS